MDLRAGANVSGPGRPERAPKRTSRGPAGGRVEPGALDRPLRLLPRVRRYDWGTRDFIPRLLGREPSDEPEAELWFGAHPDAPASVVLEAGSGGGPHGPDGERGAARAEAPAASRPGAIPFDRLIAGRPAEILGAGGAGEARAALPFLTKILSADRPLSIQAHPDREQAERGFAAETDGGARGSAAEGRIYRDPNHKPELIYALTPFEAMSGFRPAAEAARLLAALNLDELRPHVRHLRKEGAAAYARLLSALRGPAGNGLAERAVAAAWRAVTVLANASAATREALRWIVRIADHHPEDPLVVAPLFLRLVHLEPGEVLFTGPGVPHSYLEGSGVEVMASSDNVLRFGLTSKPVDADAFLDILHYRTLGDPGLETEVEEPPWGRRTRFTPPVADFRLEILEVAEHAAAPLPGDDGPRIALALEGDIEVGNLSGEVRLRPGQAALLPAAARSVAAAGAGKVAVTMPNR